MSVSETVVLPEAGSERITDDTCAPERGADLAELSDSALAHAITGGDRDALTEAYVRHGSRVHGIARRLCGQSRADDVTQEVFLRLWARPEVYDADRGSLRTFLSTQTRSRALDLLRSDSSRQARECANLRRGTATEIGVEVSAFAKLDGEEVERALTLLPDRERDAIVLAYFGGHSYREVARLLKEPEGTVKGRISSGLHRLRVDLADTWGSEVIPRST